MNSGEGDPLPDAPWTFSRGRGPVVAAAIHDGHAVRPEVAERLAVTPAERRREEDPHTGELASVVGNRVVVHRSRFEIDLSRPRRRAVYLEPEQAWGLTVWRLAPDSSLIARSLALYDSFYAELAQFLDELSSGYGRFVVLDIHTYNHRRAGPGAPPAPASDNPDIDLGTYAPEREYWAPVIEPFIGALRSPPIDGRRLDVRENAKFQFGNLGDWVHATYAGSGCVLSLDVKKFFMDEWTGKPRARVLRELKELLASTVPVLEGALEAMNRL